MTRSRRLAVLGADGDGLGGPAWGPALAAAGIRVVRSVRARPIDSEPVDLGPEPVAVRVRAAERARQVLSAVAAGFDVLTEPPIALGDTGWAALLATTARVHVAAPQRYDALYAQLRHVLASGTIGEPRAVHVGWCAPPTAVLFDLLAWWLDAEPVRITVESAGTATDGADSVALLRWSTGAVTACRFDSGAAPGSLRLAVVGTGGRMDAERSAGTASGVWGTSRPRASITVRPRDGAAYRVVPAGEPRPVAAEILTGWLADQPDELGRLPTLREAARGLAVARAYPQAVAAGRTVDIPAGMLTPSSTRGSPAPARRPPDGAGGSRRVRLPL